MCNFYARDILMNQPAKITSSDMHVYVEVSSSLEVVAAMVVVHSGGSK